MNLTLTWAKSNLLNFHPSNQPFITPFKEGNSRTSSVFGSWTERNKQCGKNKVCKCNHNPVITRHCNSHQFPPIICVNFVPNFSLFLGHFYSSFCFLSLFSFFVSLLTKLKRIQLFLWRLVLKIKGKIW